jgi:hypothetical protein
MNEATASRSIEYKVAVGFASGVLVALPAIIAAVISAGAGHGDYVLARLLFPAPCLLTLLEGDRFGAFSIGAGVLQFPIYGALSGWSIARNNYLPVIGLTVAHVIAAVDCFAGILPNV